MPCLGLDRRGLGVDDTVEVSEVRHVDGLGGIEDGKSFGVDLFGSQKWLENCAVERNAPIPLCTRFATPRRVFRA